MRQHFLTDLDGTLFRADITVSDFTVDVINRALTEGHVVSFATARSFISAKPILNRIQWIYPIVIYNGAVIIEPKTEQILWGRFVPEETTTSILDLGREFGLTPLVFGIESDGTHRVWHERLNEDGVRLFAESRRGDPRFKLRTPLSVYQGDEVFLLTYIAVERELSPFKDRLLKLHGEQIHIHFMRDTYLKDYYFLEISHPEANKETAMNAWTSMVRCNPSEVAVFGDNLNDIGLFAQAGHKVAVANAHPDLKAMADEIIDSNDEDGVAHYIASRLESDLHNTGHQ